MSFGNVLAYEVNVSLDLYPTNRDYQPKAIGKSRMVYMWNAQADTVEGFIDRNK